MNTTTTPKAHKFTDADVETICETYDVDITTGVGEYLARTLYSAGWDVESAHRHIVSATAAVQKHTAAVLDELTRGYRPGSVEWVQHNANKMADAFAEWHTAVTKVAETIHALSLLAADEVTQSECRSALRKVCFGEATD